MRILTRDDTEHGKEYVLKSEADAQQNELQALRRWKSTHAPRLEALEGLKATAQSEAAKGREAVTSLESERLANAILTDESDRMRGLLLWALYHHQGGSSPVGQPIRKALGIGCHHAMTVGQIRAASDAAAQAMKS